MRDFTVRTGAVIGALALGLLVAAGAHAQSKKIVCWKDASGKILGCGDKVPPEFQTNATKELDSRGVLRKTTESAEETAQRRAKEQEAARIAAENERKLIDQKRQDTALLQTFSSEKEIDLKRDRELQLLDLQIEQLNTGLKSATHRHADLKGRIESVEKNKKPASAGLKEDFAKATGDVERIQLGIEAKQKEKEELRKRYADHKRRYNELRSGTALTGQPLATRN